MKTRWIILSAVLVLLIAGTGCTFTIDNWQGLTPGTVVDSVERVDPEAWIHRPWITNGDDWYVNGLDEVMLLWRTDRDRYGNPTGLTDDVAWELVEVTINCPERGGVDDTIFTPGDPSHRLSYLSADGEPNAVLWWVGYVAPIEAISARPRTPYPRSGGYPALCFEDSQNIPAMASQNVTITATARAKYLRIRITAPEGKGPYTLDMPGTQEQSGNVFELFVGEGGLIDVICGDGTIFTVDVPVEWFWLVGKWTIPMGAYSGC